jgi:UDP-N-acetyl-D-mannosaminuronic acid transferase (WecB/TagA/CpsF family)
MLKTNINFVDGVGVFWRVLTLSINNLEMQTGPEIMALVSVYARQKNAKLCFIGNTEIAKHYADVNDLYNNDCLYFEPNFSSFAEDLITTDLIMRINAHKPDLIIISLGGGKQTVFANLIYNELGYSPHLILNVGAAISKFGEKTSRLSDVMKYLGVQSLLRLLYEPQKAYRRILLEDIPWMYNLGVELIKHAYQKYLSR